MKFNVTIECDAAPLVAADTVDSHLSRLAGALALFADRYEITLSGGATGSWRGDGWKKVTDGEDTLW